MSVAEAEQSRIGTTVAERYRLVRILGRGGMGVVYEAEFLGSTRHVAIKVMHPENKVDTDNVRRFMNEARAAGRVRHPNVVEVLDAGEDPEDGSLFIVLELLTGIDLATYLLRYEKLLPGETLTVVCQVLQALIVAHRENIVHRDIKPENVFLARRPSGETHVKIVDFGISKIIDPEKEISLSITRANTTVGTPHYMSPEQARGESIDPRADIWALGIVMYECLTGEIPFDGENYNQQILAVVTEEHRPASVHGVEAELSAIIDRCLQKDRDHRFTSASDMLSELGRYVARHPEIPVRPALLRIPSPEEFPTARPDDPTTVLDVPPAIVRDAVEDLTDDAQPEEFAGPLSVRPVFPGMVRIEDEEVAADSAPTRVHAVVVGGAAPTPLSQRPLPQFPESSRPAVFRAPSLPPLPPPPRLPSIEPAFDPLSAPAVRASPDPLEGRSGPVEDDPQDVEEPLEPSRATDDRTLRSSRVLFLAAAFTAGLAVALLTVVAIPRLTGRPPATAPNFARLRLLHMREDARPVIDGVRYFSNEAYIPLATRTVRIRVEADGYEPLEIGIVPDRDQDIALPPMRALAPPPTPAPSAPPPVRPRAALAPAALPSPAPAERTDVSVGATPRCRVLIDRREAGLTPLFHLHLTPGAHQIACVRPGGTETRAVQVARGGPTLRILFDHH